MREESLGKSTELRMRPPEREDLFNNVYNSEHFPLLSQVPGVISVARSETETLTMNMGGETRTIVVEGQPKHHALYQLDSPEVLERVIK